MSMGPAIGVEEFITFGRQAIGNGIITARCGATATTGRVTGAGAGLIDSRP